MADKVCERAECAALFDPATRWQRFCGWQCRNAWHGLKRTEERRKRRKAQEVDKRAN